MKKLFVYMLAAMLAVPAIDLMSKPDTEKNKAPTTVTTANKAAIGKKKPKKVKTLKSDKKTLKRKYTYRKGARQI